MNKAMIYYIRSVDRTRILGTIAARRFEHNRLAFALVIASPKDVSPSRKHGREEAAKRLDAVLAGWQHGDKFLIREDGFGKGAILGAVCEIDEIVSIITQAVINNLIPAIPTWLLKRDPTNLSFIWDYLELFCRIRNDVERAAGK